MLRMVAQVINENTALGIEIVCQFMREVAKKLQ